VDSAAQRSLLKYAAPQGQQRELLIGISLSLVAQVSPIRVAPAAASWQATTAHDDGGEHGELECGHVECTACCDSEMTHQRCCLA